MTIGKQIAELADHVPAGAWAALAVANVVMTIGTWSAARRRMRRAGERAANPGLLSGSARAKDTALTVASMIPAALFWAMVLAGSFHGLVAFGRDTLGWRDGWEYLVPGTLDGVSVTFAFLAFRAVRKQKAPDRCYRVVWGAAIASAVVNFAYEYADSGHNIIAGGYLALLSLFGMVMFHEFLDQFEEGTAYIKRENPKFGLRWITWPTNTLCAAIAWRNHPPVEDTPATVREAVANLDRVRALKRAARETAAIAKHERALLQSQRRAERAAARSGQPQPVAAEDRPGVTELPIEPAAPPASPLETAAPAWAGPTPADLGATRQDDCSSPGVRVPATAPTLQQWAMTWVQMCADGDLALGPLNDNNRARAIYDLSAKQLRNIRNAAISGALRRRAAELGVQLPTGYTDHPAASRINGHDLTPVRG